MSKAKAYRIETDRLVIRCYEPGDAFMLREAIAVSAQHLRSWLPWAKEEPTAIETKIDLVRTFRGKFDLGEDYVFGIFNKTENELLGSTGLHTRPGGNAREIGYWISVKHINKGFATETVAALTKTGFEIEQLERIEILCDPRNTRSSNIPGKLGYRHEATLKNRTTDSEGNLRDTMMWTMFKEDYIQSTTKNISVKAFDILGREITSTVPAIQ